MASLRLPHLAFLLAGAGAACSPEPESPHPHDVVLTDGQRYEKNAEVKLAREYWIIIASEDGSRAIVPRPDGAPAIAEECARGGPLAPMFRDAALCETATLTTMARVNALTSGEAVLTSTFLHAQLRFAPVKGGGVAPYVLTSDLLDVCKQFPADRAGVLKQKCDFELAAEESGARQAIAFSYSEEESEVLAARVNELYGIR